MFIQLFGLLLLMGLILFALWGYKNANVSSFIANITAKEVSRIEKLNASDFKKNHDYYRDIIHNYSPALLSYIDNFKIDLPRDIIGTIMILEQKGYLKIENGILINSNVDTSNLSKLEKYILQNIHSGNLTINSNDIKEMIQEEGLEKEVIVVNKNYKKSNLWNKIRNSILILFILAIFIFYLEETFPQIHLPRFWGILVGIFIILAVYIAITHFLYKQKLYENRKADPYFRTQKGKDINENLEGLKNYLKDYGDMKNKEAEMINLWEDYLIYAILFGENNIAPLKYLKYIKVL